MKRVGEVVRTAQGKLVVRCSGDHPDLGTTVIDEELDEVGTVVSVFGPVENPYVAISTDREQLAPYMGSVLYSRE